MTRSNDVGKQRGSELWYVHVIGTSLHHEYESSYYAYCRRQQLKNGSTKFMNQLFHPIKPGGRTSNPVSAQHGSLVKNRAMCAIIRSLVQQFSYWAQLVDVKCIRHSIFSVRRPYCRVRARLSTNSFNRCFPSSSHVQGSSAESSHFGLGWAALKRSVTIGMMKLNTRSTEFCEAFYTDGARRIPNYQRSYASSKVTVKQVAQVVGLCCILYANASLPIVWCYHQWGTCRRTAITTMSVMKSEWKHNTHHIRFNKKGKLHIWNITAKMRLGSVANTVIPFVRLVFRLKNHWQCAWPSLCTTDQIAEVVRNKNQKALVSPCIVEAFT